MFRRWLEDRGLKRGAITWEPIEWLCWLRLISPLSQAWQLHEIGLAVRKIFVGRDYVQAAKKWWKNPPKRLTYEPVDEDDGFAQRVIKQGFPQEALEWHADWLSKRLENTKDFTDTLRKQLHEIGFAYQATRGRPKTAKNDRVPSEWDEQEAKTEAEAWRLFAAVLLRKNSASDAFSADAAKEDFEKDEPKGWLLAKSIIS